MTDRPTQAPVRNPVEQLADEFVRRFRCGERPSLTEYCTRYPELADEIRELFPALVVMEQLAPHDSDDHGPAPGAGSELRRTPEQLGEYRILRELGRGGMGVVYEAEQASLGRHVALKVLPFHTVMNPMHLERFRREARAAARLHHTNIVPVFGVGESQGIHFFAMQFIQGQGLDEVLAEVKRLRAGRGLPAGPPPPVESPGGPTPDDASNRGDAVSAQPLTQTVAVALLSGQFEPCSILIAESDSAGPADRGVQRAGAELPGVSEQSTIRARQSEFSTQPDQHFFLTVARMGAQTADALAYAHGQGVLHRDIKPSNLLLDAQGTVWLTDFGLAKVEGMDDVTHSGDIVGTLRYMAPERFQGAADERSDVYSLGVTLYEMLTLRAAFDESDRHRLVKQITHDDPRPPRRIDPHIPRDLETIVLKATAKEPAHRYQSAAEMADDLRQFIEDRPIRARRALWPERVWRWCRRNPVAATLAGLAAASFVAGFAGVWSQWRRAEKNFRYADEQRQLVQQMLSKVETERLRAEGNFAWAQEAVNKLLSEASEGLADIPAAQAARRSLLQKALRLHEEFLDEQAADPTVRLDAVRALRRMADIHHMLGQPDDAEKALDQAAGIIEPMPPSARDTATYRSELAAIHAGRGKMLASQLQYGSAVAAYRKALAILDDVHGDDRQSAHARMERIDILREIAAGLEMTGDLGEAEEAYRAAMDAWQALSDKHAGDPAFRHGVAKLFNSYGILLRKTNRLDAADESIRRAIGMLEELQRDAPRPLYRRQLAESLTNLGNLVLTRDQLDEAAAAYARSAELFEVLMDDFPDVPVYRQRLGNALIGLGVVHRRVQRYEDAEAVYQRAIEVQQGLIDRFGNAPDYRSGLAMTYGNLANILQLTGRHDESEPHVVFAAELRQKLADEFPDVPDYQSRLGVALGNLGRFVAERADGAEPERGIEILLDALSHHRNALDRNPDHPEYRTRMRFDLVNLASAYLSERAHADAARTVDEILRAAPPVADTILTSAAILARSASLAAADETLSESERRALAETYVDRAVALLRDAIDRGMISADVLSENDSLEPLRASPGFRALLDLP